MSQVSNRGGKNPNRTTKPSTKGMGRNSPKGSGPKTTGKWNNKPNDFNTKNQGKSLFIRNIFNKFGNSSLEQKLFEQQVTELKALFQKLGTVEHINYDNERNSMIVTFDSFQTAKKVLKMLTSKDEREKLMKSLESSMSTKQCCPTLHAYNYTWYEGKQNLPKTAYAPSIGSQPQQQIITQTFEKKDDSKIIESKENENKVKGEKRKKEKTQQKIENNIKGNNENIISNNEIINQQVKQIPMDSENLRKEADRMKLDEEIKYLTRQELHITSEIKHEKERLIVRIARITKFSEELEKVKIESAKLEKQIKEEQKWKDSSDITIQKLEEELDHVITQLQTLQNPQE